MAEADIETSTVYSGIQERTLLATCKVYNYQVITIITAPLSTFNDAIKIERRIARDRRFSFIDHVRRIRETGSLCICIIMLLLYSLNFRTDSFFFFFFLFPLVFRGTNKNFLHRTVIREETRNIFTLLRYYYACYNFSIPISSFSIAILILRGRIRDFSTLSVFTSNLH